MAWSIDEEDATMLRGDTPSPMNDDINDQFTSKIIEICFDNPLQMLCISLLCFANIGKIDYSKIVEIWLAKTLNVQL